MIRQLKRAALWLGGLAVVGVLAATALRFVTWSRPRGPEREELVAEARTLEADRRTMGWTTNALATVKKAASLARGNDARDMAAATLAGYEARLIWSESNAASSLAWDAAGKRLLIGSYSDERSRTITHLFDAERGLPAALHGSVSLPGPTAWRPDGSPLQLVRRLDTNQVLRFSLVDFQSNAVVRRFVLGTNLRARREAWALSADGSRAAGACVISNAGPGEIGLCKVWGTESGLLLAETNLAPSVMAFSSDGNLLAMGFADGKVRVFALPAFAGVAAFETEDNAITGLAFGHDAVRTSDSGSLSGARLAASDRAGGIFVWELAKRRLLGRLRETSLEVVALAFSPDGTLLASGGRGEVRLWDIVNEHSVLRFTGAGPMDYATAVAFSPDGTRLAGSSRRVLHPAHTWIAELSPHRGIQSLYGLNGWIERVWLSSDGRYVAALAQNWRLGVWERATGRLLHVFAGLEGSLPDNTAVIIHPDGRLYFSSAQMVRVWKLASGQESDAIRLPYGLCDAMRLTANGRLLLLRREAGIVSKGPYTWKLRDLLGADPAAVLHSQTDRSWGSYYCAIAPDGNSFVVTGPSATQAPVRQECVVVYDTATGSERWRSNYPAALGHTSPIFSWDGRAVRCALDGTNSHWLSLANGSLVDAGPFDLLTPEFQSSEAPDSGFGLRRRGDAKHRLILGAQYGPIRSSTVSPDGRLLAWGTERGVVLVAHLEEIQRRLKEFGAGLEW